MQISQQTVYSVARGVAYGAAAFTLIVCVLIIANYLQTKAMDPLNSEALATLMQKLDKDPANQELRDQIRALDLLSRKAYFVSQWQLKTGAYFLLGGVILLLAALKTMSSARKTVPALAGKLADNEAWLTSAKARQWITGVGIVLLGTTIIFAGFAYHDIATVRFDKTVSPISEEDFLRNWPGFRGPGGNGIALVDQAPLAWEVESGQGIKWQAAVPKPGHSSPVIWDDRIFLSGGDEESLEVYCFDAESGELLWQRQANDADGAQKKIKLNKETGFAAPTMAANGRYVFAIFATGQVVCFDMNSNQVWTRNLGMPDNHYGHSSSLIAHDNLLIVQFDQNSDGWLLGLDALTGNTVWRVERDLISWSSPIIVETGNRLQLIVTNSEYVDSYDPKTGVKLWGVKCLSGEHGPSPAYADGMVFVANENSSAFGIRLGENGAEIAWEYHDELPDAASPVATDKYVFLLTSYGYIACLDAKSGEELWAHEFDSGFYASPIIAGNRVYALDRSGVMHIFEAAAEFKSLGDFAIGEKTVSSPAFVGNKLYIRGDKSLFCISRD
jgi:outer membrane protein assembly factor BamB